MRKTTKQYTSNVKKTSVTIKPVTWTFHRNKQIPLKYQAMAMVIRRDDTVKIITGNPISSREGALESLRHELIQRRDDITNAIDILERDYPTP